MNQIDSTMLAQLTQLLGTAFSAGLLTGPRTAISKVDTTAGEGYQWYRVQFHPGTDWKIFVGAVQPPDTGPGQATELLSETVSILAKLLGSDLGNPATLPVPEVSDGQITLQLKIGGDSRDVLLSLDAPTIGRLTAPTKKPTAAGSIMDTLMNVELPVSILIASREASLSDVLQWGAGAVIEFEDGLDDPVDIIVNKQTVARGAVVLVNGNYGVRVTEVLAGANPISAF